ncbi:MAG: hypothetical protein MJ071_06640 [Oscillospiraceae bacterium]|nr:hypothetical protein [Oscillospiraceae bacterium]
MNQLFILLAFAAENEEMVNITPVLLRFMGKFFLIFGVVALITVLTPWIAKKVDAFREKHSKPAIPEDPRCKAVRGPYDISEPQRKQVPAREGQKRRRPPVEGRSGAAERTQPAHQKRRRPPAAEGTQAPPKRKPRSETRE